MKGSTASVRGYLSRYSQHLNVGPRRCRSVRRLRRRRVSLRNNVSSAWFFVLGTRFLLLSRILDEVQSTSTKHKAPTLQVQSSKSARVRRRSRPRRLAESTLLPHHRLASL